MGGFTNFLHFCLFFSSFTLLTFFSSTTLSVDTLTSTQYLTINQTLVSEKEIFELGFFSPRNSSWYLGIWYKHIPDKTVVWVANRDKPLNNSGGILRIGEGGNIVLLDQYGSSTWSSNQTAARNPVLQILDSGNLILKEQNETDSSNHLWQSFDYPTDTLLPGMELGWDFDTNTERHLTSWTTNKDPKSGDFSFKLDINGRKSMSFSVCLLPCDNTSNRFQTHKLRGGRMSQVDECYASSQPNKL